MKKHRRFDDSFFKRPSMEVAPDLLGSQLCFWDEGGFIRKLTVSETEAYHGSDDLASHASKGRTVRNNLMFGAANHWYLYICYGMYWMLNLVTGQMNEPSSVFFRGTLEVSGPGKLTQKIGVDNQFNGLINSPVSKLWLEKPLATPIEIQQGPRIGVNRAGPIWSNKPYRFWFSKGTTLG